MQTPEIVSPAGNLEKLQFAVRYGAHAVYFGGEGFNLRVRAGAMTPDDIAAGIAFCHEHGVRTIFLLNAFLHERDIEPVRRYLRELVHFPFDAVMIADPGMLTLVREAGATWDLHLSTQACTLNHLSVRFWRDAGISRIVLARETTLAEIRQIRERTDAPLEIFAHGALCVAYSGRCLLSRYLAGRDSNQGDCAHPCRWNYSLVESKRPGTYLDIHEEERGTEILSSKDLCLLPRLPEYIDAGVDAFKIEGRMKSIYHVANTTRIYRDAVRLAGTPAFDERLPFWLAELDLISHRPYTDDLFNEFENGFSDIPYVRNALFLGYRTGGDAPENEAIIRTSNPIYDGETIEAIYPIDGEILDHPLTVTGVWDKEGTPVPLARPNSEYRLRFDRAPGAYALLRRRIGGESGGR